MKPKVKLRSGWKYYYDEVTKRWRSSPLNLVNKPKADLEWWGIANTPSQICLSLAKYLWTMYVHWVVCYKCRSIQYERAIFIIWKKMKKKRSKEAPKWEIMRYVDSNHRLFTIRCCFFDASDRVSRDATSSPSQEPMVIFYSTKKSKNALK